MNRKEIKTILSCAGNIQNLKVGDMIMIPYVSNRLKITPEYAKQLLNEIASMGYLRYDEGGIDPISKMGRIAGWHYTSEGITLLHE